MKIGHKVAWQFSRTDDNIPNPESHSPLRWSPLCHCSSRLSQISSTIQTPQHPWITVSHYVPFLKRKLILVHG